MGEPAFASDTSTTPGESREEILERLFARYHRMVKAEAHRLVRDSWIAEDVAQEVYYWLWVRLARGEPPCPQAWLRVVARHLSIDYLRRRKLARQKEQLRPSDQPGQQEQLIPTAELPLEGEYLRRLLYEALRAAVRRLSPAYRHVILLRYWRGLDYLEIAEEARVPLGTVKSRLNHARLRLTRLLQEGEGGEGCG